MHLPQSETAGTKKLPVINGLRGIAILAVIYHHLATPFIQQGWGMAFGHRVPTVVFLILRNGFQGVALFFILSGFVLSLPYFSGQRSMTTFSDAMAFYRRRFRRLFPLYAIVSLVSLIFFYPHRLLLQSLLLSTVTFIFSQKHFMITSNWVLWSLGVEIWFSVLFPIILVGVNRFGIRSILLFGIFIGLLARTIGLLLSPDQVITPLSGGPLGRLDDFILGIVLAHLWVHVRKKPLRFGFPLGCAMLLFGFFIFEYSFSAHIIAVPLRILMNLCVSLGLFFMIDALIRGGRSTVQWFLESSWLQMIGLMCYSLYVWHGIMMVTLNAQSDLLHVCRYLLLLFLFSFLSYRYIEFGFVADVCRLLPSAWAARLHSLFVKTGL